MRRFLIVAALLIPLAGCSDSSSLEAPGGVPNSVTVTLDRNQIELGESTTATAVLRDDYDRVMPPQAITWSSSSPSTATVSDAGVVTAILTGNITITAKAAGRQGSAALVVVRPAPKAVASVELIIAEDTMVTFGAVRARTVVRDIAGEIVTRPLQWRSTNPLVAPVSTSGFITALGGGSSTIIVEVEGKADSVTVTVPPVAQIVATSPARMRMGETYQLNAVARTADGRVVARPISWASVDQTRGTVTNTGSFTPLVSGSVELRMTSDGVTGTFVAEGFGWVGQATATGFIATLEADDPIGGTYPVLSIGCDAGTPFLHIAVPFSPSGTVTDPWSYDVWGDYLIVQWTVTPTGVRMPAASTAAFRSIVTLQTAAHANLTMYVQRSGGASWEEVWFSTSGLRAAVAPAGVQCPAFAP